MEAPEDPQGSLPSSRRISCSLTRKPTSSHLLLGTFYQLCGGPQTEKVFSLNPSLGQVGKSCHFSKK